MTGTIFADDGTTYTTIQTAANSSSKIYLGPGTFTLPNSRLVLPNIFTLEGAGEDVTTITIPANFGVAIGTNPIAGVQGEVMITNTSSGTAGQSSFTTIDSHITLRNLTIDGNGSNQSRKVYGLLLQYVSFITLENVRVINCGRQNSTSAQTTEALGNYESAGVWLRNCTDFTLNNIRNTSTDGVVVSLCKRGFINNINVLTSTSESVYISSCFDIELDGLISRSSEGYGIYLGDDAGVGSLNYKINNLYIDTTVHALTPSSYFPSPGIRTFKCKDVSITNFTIKGCHSNGIFMDLTDDFVLENGRVYDNNTSNQGTYNENIRIESSTAFPITRGLVKNVKVYDTTGLVKYGAHLTGDLVSNVTFEGSESFGHTTDGFINDTTTTSNIKFFRNKSHENGQHGINNSIASDNSIYAHNETYLNISRGIVATSATNSKLDNNLSYNNGLTGLTLLGTSTYNTISNNHAYDDQGSPTQQQGISSSSSSDHNVYTGNILYGNTGNQFFISAGTGLNDSRDESNIGMESTFIQRVNRDWNGAGEGWIYASAATITVPSGATSKYTVGDRIKLTQTTVKYFVITAVSSTVLTITGGTDYTLTNAAISANFYSKVSNPNGFPDWFTYAPTTSGWSADPTNTSYRFRLTNRRVDISIRQSSSGTSNATTTTLTAPLTSANNTNEDYFWPAVAFDNGSILTAPACATLPPNSATITIHKTYALANGWTNSAGKAVNFSGSYEI